MLHSDQFIGEVITQLTSGLWGFEDYLGGERKGEQRKVLCFSVIKTAYAEQQNKSNIRKDSKNMHFRKVSPKQVLKFRLKSSISHNQNEWSGYRKLIKSINKAGKQVVNTRLGRVFLN